MSGAFVLNGYLAGVLALAAIGGLVALAHLVIVQAHPVADDSKATRRRRGIKALVIGRDGRASTSKTQALLWTGAIIYAFAFLLLWGRSINCGEEEHRAGERCMAAAEARDAFRDAIDQGLQTEYYVLLGFPVGAALAAKALTTNKMASGDLTKASIDESPAEETGVVAGLAQVVSNDQGESDLLDFQYLAFNLLALTYFAVEFVSHPAAGIPDLPPTLVALAGVGASAYTAKKALEHDLAPVLKSLVPSRLPLSVGAEFTVIGTGFETPSPDAGSGSAVLVDGVPTRLVQDLSRGGVCRLRVALTEDHLAAIPQPEAEITRPVWLVDAGGTETEPKELVLIRQPAARSTRRS